MTAVGLLLEHAEPEVRDGVLRTLRSFGEELYTEIEDRRYEDIALDADLHPCPPGTHIDPETGMCVPD
jgi:hypothetical protein